MTEGRHDWAATFEAEYAAPPSAVQARVWREVLGDEYPAEVEPYSYVSVSELHRFAHDLRVGPGDTLVDVGCGRGGPGLWVAARTGVVLVGLDIAERALAESRRRARAVGLAGATTFRTGSFEDTGLAAGSADAVMSIDSFLFATDKARALSELARVLRPGGRLAFTSWDFDGQPPDRPPQVRDHRPLLEDAGLAVLAYDETDDWRTRQDRTNEGLLAAAEALAAESGEDAGAVRDGVAHMMLVASYVSRRVFVVAQRR